jgi:hypothetical protein
LSTSLPTSQRRRLRSAIQPDRRSRRRPDLLLCQSAPRSHFPQRPSPLHVPCRSRLHKSPKPRRRQPSRRHRPSRSRRRQCHHRYRPSPCRPPSLSSRPRVIQSRPLRNHVPPRPHNPRARQPARLRHLPPSAARPRRRWQSRGQSLLPQASSDIPAEVEVFTVDAVAPLANRSRWRPRIRTTASTCRW